eukprot:m.107999 g.107999  ORF g.107999 m.107999 type:complete len:695 (-) comp8994_c0_seq6:680-2764(-)
MSECCVCHERGIVETCAECKRRFHARCDGDTTAREGEDAWRCSDCRAVRAANAAEAAGAGCEIAATDLKRVPLGRSLTNALPAAKKRGRVNGPCSALSSFLEEKGIVAPRRAFSYSARSREEAAPASAAASATAASANAEEEEDHTASESDVEEPTATPARATRARGRGGLAAAAAGLDEALRGGEGKAKGTDSAKKRPAEAKGAKAVKKHKSADDDDADDDGANRPARPAHSTCGTCGVRVPGRILLCKDCQRRSLKKGKATGKAKKASALLDDLRGRMYSLQDLCIRVVSANINLVDAFGEIPPEAIDKICRLVCVQRRLASATLGPFLRDDTTALNLFDCADIEAESYHLIGPSCPNLTQLSLVNCGLIEGEVRFLFPHHLPLVFVCSSVSLSISLSLFTSLACWKLPDKPFSLQALRTIGKHCSRLEHVVLDGCFRVADIDVAVFLDKLPALRRLELRNSMKIAVDTARAIAAKPRGLEHLALDTCTGFTDEALAALDHVHGLQSLSLANSELISNVSLVPFLERHGRHLQELCVRGLRRLGDDFGLAVAAHCPALAVLDLHGVDALSAAVLATIWKGCPKLTSADLTRVSKADDTCIAALSRAAPRLRHLRLNALPLLTPAGVLAAVKSLSDLEDLDISFIKGFDDAVLGKVLSACPRVAKVSVWGCTRVSRELLLSHPSLTLIGCSHL